MEIATRTHEGRTVVELVGRLDATTAADLEKHCADLVEQGVGKIALDLTRVDYLSSAGLRSILTVAKRLKGLGGGLAVGGTRGMVKEVFAISGLGALMPVADDLESALAALS